MVRLVVLDMAIVLARIILVAGLTVCCDTTKPLPACVGIAAVIFSLRKKKGFSAHKCWPILENVWPGPRAETLAKVLAKMLAGQHVGQCLDRHFNQHVGWPLFQPWFWPTFWPTTIFHQVRAHRNCTPNEPAEMQAKVMAKKYCLTGGTHFSSKSTFLSAPYILAHFPTYFGRALWRTIWPAFWPATFWPIFWPIFWPVFWQTFWPTFWLTFWPRFWPATFWHIFWPICMPIFWPTFWPIFWPTFWPTFWRKYWPTFGASN